MSPLVIYLLSALIAGIIAGGGAFMAVATADNPTITPLTWGAVIITGLIAAAKDIQSRMQPPPPPVPPTQIVLQK